MIIIPILTTSLIHYSLKGWENVLFELGSERVNRKTYYICLCCQWFANVLSEYEFSLRSLRFSTTGSAAVEAVQKQLTPSTARLRTAHAPVEWAGPTQTRCIRSRLELSV